MNLQRSTPSPAPHGGLLPIAMVMTALGGIFMFGWVSLCNMRAQHAANMANATQRHLALYNSKAYGRELGLERVLLSSNTLGALQTGSLDSGWGTLDTDLGWVGLQSFSLPTTPITASSQVTHASNGRYISNFPFNHNGLRPGDTFASTQLRLARPDSGGPSSTYDGGIDRYYNYLIVKTICPTLAGDGFVIYRKPTLSVSPLKFGKYLTDSTRDAYTIRVNGRLVVRDPASFFDDSSVSRGGVSPIGLSSRSLYIQKNDPQNKVTGNDFAGTSSSPLSLAPLRLPATVSSSGPFSVTPSTLNTSHLYRGELNVVNNSSHTNNSLRHIQDREVAAGRATLTEVNSSTTFGSNTDALWVAEATDHTNAPVKPVNASTGSSRYRTLYIRTGHASLPHIRITNGAVHQIVFLGQSTQTEYNANDGVNTPVQAPRIILLLPASGTPTAVTHDIEFIGESSRRLILGMKDSLETNIDIRWGKPDATITTNLGITNISGRTFLAGTDIGSTPTSGTLLTNTIYWHVITINEGRHLTLWANYPSGTTRAAIVGGMMTNASVERSTSESTPQNFPITFYPDYYPSYDLAMLAPRDGWLENYFQLIQP